MRLLAYCLMPNHWHLVLWPELDGQLTRFMAWLTGTHARRWHVHRGSVGTGHLYQGRFHSFPVQDDRHLLAVCRYVEANAFRADLVARSERWPWGSAWLRVAGPPEAQTLLSPWPTPRPSNWAALLNEPLSVGTLRQLRTSVVRGRPYGEEKWTRRVTERLDLHVTFHDRGRPWPRR